MEPTRLPGRPNDMHKFGRGVLGVVVVLLAGCASGSAGEPMVSSRASAPHVSPSVSSGVAGTTFTLRCPVLREPSCPDVPVAAHVVVTGEDGTVRGTADSAADGRFEIAVPPGAYKVRATPPPGAVLQGVSAQVSVEPAQLAVVRLRLDSGIR